MNSFLLIKLKINNKKMEETTEKFSKFVLKKSQFTYSATKLEGLKHFKAIFKVC